jgi:prevent-host-death family protein
MYTFLDMDRYLNVTEARKSLLEVVDSLGGNDRVVITKHGTPRVVLVDFERYAMLESVAWVLQDPGRRAAMQRSWEELQQGKLVRPPRGARPSAGLLRKLVRGKGTR